jgi:hypothetical protein
MRILGFALILVVLGCSNTKEPTRKRPSYVISEDSMAILIAEHYVLNTISQDREVRKKRLTDFVKIDQKQLYDSFNITQAKFDTSMQYYLEDYRDMIKLHQTAMELLSARMAELKATGVDSARIEPKISLEKLEARNKEG